MLYDEEGSGLLFKSFKIYLDQYFYIVKLPAAASLKLNI